MSYNRVIRFPEPLKAITFGSVEDPPVPAVETAEKVRLAQEQGKADATAFYKE